MTIRTACVIGWPIRHSRSPLIHRYWLETLGISGDYVATPVEPDRIAAFLRSYPESGFIGGNVTVPHKEAAFAGVAEADAVATALGAVNTLWIEDGRLRGSNTDPYGFLANLDERSPGWDRNGGKAVVLGAGGAARGVIWALRSRGFAPVMVVNRTTERAQQVAAMFAPAAEPVAWQDLGRSLADAALLVNTTTLGMAGQPALEIDLSPLPASAVVTDIVYVPLETPLLKQAKARGLKTVDGLGMLLHQAVPGFERWFGTRPSVTAALRARIVADLDGH